MDVNGACEAAAAGGVLVVVGYVVECRNPRECGEIYETNRSGNRPRTCTMCGARVRATAILGAPDTTTEKR